MAADVPGGAFGATSAAGALTAVLFSSPDYPLFLGAVFLLYGLLRSHGQLGVFARVALMLLLGDLIFLLVSKHTETLWDPVGGVVLSYLAGSARDGYAAAPLWQYALGTVLLAGAVWVGRRHGGALVGDGAQRWLGLALTGACAAVGLAVAVTSASGDLDALTAGFVRLGHLAYLAILGVAIGASIPDPASPSVGASRALGALLVLFAASSLFYLAWCVAMHGAYRYLLALLLATISLDFYLGLAIERARRATTRRALLIVSLVSNLGVLAIFKYADFFLLEVLGLPLAPLGLILPAGISFHTFQSLSYTIDVYRKEIRATSSILEFSTFVLFFPQLVAGPIVRAKDLLPQLQALPAFDHQRASDGLYRIAIGLWKKIALADTLALTIVDGVFSAPERFSSVEVLAGVVGYAFQIYLDFSAYSDIALGSAQLLGFTMPENFRTPYRSATLQEFWRRWHMSLSTWLRDYLYIPLGGSRGGSLGTYRNLLITMVLGGLWHGANWTFIVWGLLHGGGLAMARALEERGELGPRPLRQAALACAGLAVVGGLSHALLLGSLHGWAELALSWLYLTPLWAAVTVLLSRAAKAPWPRVDVTARRRQLARAVRLCMAALVLGLLLALRHGDTALWVPAVLLVLAAAAVAAALDAGYLVARATLISAAARVGATSLVFVYVVVAWVFFRATSFDNALAVFRSLGAFELDHANVTPLVQLALVAAAAGHLFPDRTFAWLRGRFIALSALQQGLALAASALVLRELSNPRIVPFIYFQF